MNRLKRFASLAAGVALAALVLTGGPALAALRQGTAGPDVLVGTHGADQITGRAGNDTLKGLAGNDVYRFADGFGADTLVEKATYQVDGQTVPGGVDTLNFAAVTGNVEGTLIPQDRAVLPPGYGNRVVAGGPGGGDPGYSAVVALGASVVENVVGGRGASDRLTTGAGANRLNPGGGGTDWLYDAGGRDDGPGGMPELPPSNDTYAGFGKNTGNVYVYDWGGGADVLDLRPFAAGEVYRLAIDADNDGDLDSLQLYLGGNASVFVYGHFGPFSNYTRDSGQRGHIEQLVFADGAVAGSEAASSEAAAAGGREAERAAAAARSLAQARRDLAAQSAPGTPPQ